MHLLQECRKKYFNGRKFILLYFFQVNCTNGTSSSRLGRTILKGEVGEILDKLEVFNSVEVIAPEIELDNDLRESSTKNKGKNFPKIVLISVYKPFFVYNVKYKFAHKYTFIIPCTLYFLSYGSLNLME